MSLTLLKVARFNVVGNQIRVLDAPNTIRKDGQWQLAGAHTFVAALTCCSYLSWGFLHDLL